MAATALNAYVKTHFVLDKKSHSDSDEMLEREMKNTLTDSDKAKRLADVIIERLYCHSILVEGSVLVDREYTDVVFPSYMRKYSISIYNEAITLVNSCFSIVI